MPNIAPVAVLDVSSLSIKLPINSVSVSLSNSYDPNKRGVIAKYEFILPNGVMLRNMSTDTKTAEVVFLRAGNFVIIGKVTDLHGLIGTQTKIVTVSEADIVTTFGASGPSIGDIATLQLICGKPSVSRVQTILSSYGGRGDKGLETFINAGIPMFWNLNYKNVEKDGSGNKIPNHIPNTDSELNAYQTALESALKYYQGHYKQDLIICTIENEITTSAFHANDYDGAMDDYGNMLKRAVASCKKYGYKNITDSGVHVGTILGADDPNGQGKGSQVAQLLQIFAGIPELTRINCHTNGGNEFDSSSIPKADAKAFGITGRHLWSNEWHSTSADGVTKIAQGWHDAGVLYSIYISGTNSDYVLNNNTNLTSFGDNYKKFINAHLS